ncbi:MAG TPA: hypothetical protein VMZ50_05415 [Phycisphaerae bacterium]|nr:hypothetical protein [Phycisphaerae bacterium]
MDRRQGKITRDPEQAPVHVEGAADPELAGEGVAIDAAADQAAAAPAEQTPGVPAEQTANAPAEQTANAPAEQTANAPAEH